MKTTLPSGTHEIDLKKHSLDPHVIKIINGLGKEIAINWFEHGKDFIIILEYEI